METDTIVKDSRDDFEKHILYNYNYIASVIEVNGGSFLLKRPNQPYLDLIMSTVVLRF